MWTSLNQYSQPVWTSLIQLIKGNQCTTNKNWFEQCELWTSLIQFEPVSQKLVWAVWVWTSLIQLIKGNHWLHCSCTKTGLSSLNQFSQPAWMSPWTAHAQPVRTGLSSVNQFKPVFPASLNQFDPVSAWKSMTIYTMKCELVLAVWTSSPIQLEWVNSHAQPVRTGLSSVNQFKPVFPTSLNQFDDNLHYAAHAQKLVRTGFSSLNQFSYPVRTSLIQFLHGSQWQSTLHCTLLMTMLLMHKNW